MGQKRKSRGKDLMQCKSPDVRVLMSAARLSTLLFGGRTWKTGSAHRLDRTPVVCRGKRDHRLSRGYRYCVARTTSGLQKVRQLYFYGNFRFLGDLQRLRVNASCHPPDLSVHSYSALVYRSPIFTKAVLKRTRVPLIERKYWDQRD